MNKFFTLVGGAFTKLFTAPQPLLKGSQGAAVTTIGEHLNSIGKILQEGNVAPEYGDIVIAKMYEVQALSFSAVQYGWNNGKGTEY